MGGEAVVHGAEDAGLRVHQAGLQKVALLVVAHLPAPGLKRLLPGPLRQGLRNPALPDHLVQDPAHAAAHPLEVLVAGVGRGDEARQIEPLGEGQGRGVLAEVGLGGGPDAHGVPPRGPR